MSNYRNHENQRFDFSVRQKHGDPGPIKLRTIFPHTSVLSKVPQLPYVLTKIKCFMKTQFFPGSLTSAQIKSTTSIWALVKEPGFLDFQISRIAILEIFLFCKIILENLVVGYRGKIIKVFWRDPGQNRKFEGYFQYIEIPS